MPRATDAASANSRRDFAAGRYQVACALIIGTCTEVTDEKLAMMQEARQFGVPLVQP